MQPDSRAEVPRNKKIRVLYGSGFSVVYGALYKKKGSKTFGAGALSFKSFSGFRVKTLGREGFRVVLLRETGAKSSGRPWRLVDAGPPS